MSFAQQNHATIATSSSTETTSNGKTYWLNSSLRAVQCRPRSPGRMRVQAGRMQASQKWRQWFRRKAVRENGDFLDLALLLRFQIQQHDDEQKEHHDRAGINDIWTAARKNACNSTNSPAIEMMVSTRNIALVTGCAERIRDDRTPNSNVSAAKT